MPLSPPLCLYITVTLNGSDPLNPTNPNLYWCTLTINTPQTYSSGQYDGTNISTEMWATSNTNGIVFKIQRVLSSPIPTSGSVDVILEDVGGYNAIIDPTQGLQGGAPSTNTAGYVFEINPLTGLPALTSIDTTPTLTFPDSILGRFIYDQKGPTGTFGPTGSAYKAGFLGEIYTPNENDTFTISATGLANLAYTAGESAIISGTTSFTVNSGGAGNFTGQVYNGGNASSAFGQIISSGSTSSIYTDITSRFEGIVGGYTGPTGQITLEQLTNISGLFGGTGVYGINLAGQRGTSIRAGDGAPTGTIGRIGDIYIDVQTMKLYIKQ